MPNFGQTFIYIYVCVCVCVYNKLSHFEHLSISFHQDMKMLQYFAAIQPRHTYNIPASPALIAPSSQMGCNNRYQPSF